ncbi:MAG: hypothetical protein KZQ94_19745 [Candidatus Thiodiazotropha sp. (ex Troendleina suluensis)]|nr:hypothetical protein [Candidatus Thiodiazotropha sp. (ex Troendleina suluensis)]
MDADTTLPDLTPDNRVWRVNWLGEVAYPGQIHRYTQPCLKVILSPLLCDHEDSKALMNPDCTNNWETHDTWVPVSTLPLLSIGSLWQNGNELLTPQYQIKRFERLQINAESTTLIKAGLSLDGSFLLPLSHHPWHRGATQSYCIMVTLPDNIRLIIPCMELIRFYFGSSGNLVQRLFTTPLITNSLWARKRYDESKRHLHLVLANRISGASAADIGRIAASKYAKRSATIIYSSCQKASTQRESVHPFSGFPFEGKTDLATNGMWLPFGEKEDATFIAYRLRSCSHPFPFQSLSYESSDKAIRHTNYSNSASGKRGFATRKGNRPRKIVNSDPSKLKAQRHYKLKKEHRFPDLVPKQVWRDKIDALPAADIFVMKSDGSLEQISYGESNYKTGTTGVDTIAQSEDERRNLPKFVKNRAFSSRPKSKIYNSGLSQENSNPHVSG